MGRSVRCRFVLDLFMHFCAYLYMCIHARTIWKINYNDIILSNFYPIKNLGSITDDFDSTWQYLAA